MKFFTLFLSIVLFFSTAQPVFVQDAPPQIEVIKLNENLYKLWVYDYVYVIVMGGSEGILLVDTGFEQTADQLHEKIQELFHGKIHYIINTHADGDHTGGNAYFGIETVILSHPDVRELLINEPSFKLEGLPDITFRNSLTLFFNRQPVHCIHIPGSHSGEDILIHFPKMNLLCLGDIIVPDSFPFVRIKRGATIKRLLDNIDWLLNEFPDDVTYVLSHGRDYNKNDLREYRKMIAEATAAVKEAIIRGLEPAEMKETNILAQWEKWNNKRWEFINTDLWIDTVWGLMQKKEP